MTAPFFSVQAMTQRFGGLVAIDDLSCEVQQGEVFGVIGPNGAGKTTFLNCICGAHRNVLGSVTLDGRSLTGLPPHRIGAAGIARTFQAADYFADFRVADFLLMSRLGKERTSLFACMLGLPGVRRSELDERRLALAMLDDFGLGATAEQRLGDLSYGTRKKLDVCRALMMEPRLLLMDEPTSGTSLEDREQLREVIRGLRERGLTTIVVDHDVQFLADTCDRLLAMNFGRVLGVGTPEDVLNRKDVIDAYIGLEAN